METFEQRDDKERAVEERVFQVKEVSGICKGPEAGPGERMVGNKFGQEGKGKALPLFLLCQTGMKAAACRPTSIPELQGDNGWESALRGRARAVSLMDMLDKARARGTLKQCGFSSLLAILLSEILAPERLSSHLRSGRGRAQRGEETYLRSHSKFLQSPFSGLGFNVLNKY